MKKTAYLILSVVILTMCTPKEECGDYYITFTPEELNFFPYRDGQTVSFITDKDTVKEFKITVNRDYISDVNPFFNSKCKKYFFDYLAISFKAMKDDLSQDADIEITIQKHGEGKKLLEYAVTNTLFRSPSPQIHAQLVVDGKTYQQVYEYVAVGSSYPSFDNARLFYTTEKGIIKIIHPDGTYWTLKQ